MPAFPDARSDQRERDRAVRAHRPGHARWTRGAGAGRAAAAGGAGPPTADAPQPVRARRVAARVAAHQQRRFASRAIRNFSIPDGYPAVAPPWGTLSAINLNTGEYAWQVPLGEYPDLAAQGTDEHGQRELRRSGRHRGRPRLHRRDESRSQDSRVRQGDRRAALGVRHAVVGQRDAGRVLGERP